MLPIIIQMPGGQPELFEMPQNAVLEVPLSHPDFPWFAEMGLKWHATPVISSKRMEIGGVSYTEQAKQHGRSRIEVDADAPDRPPPAPPTPELAPPPPQHTSRWRRILGRARRR